MKIIDYLLVFALLTTVLYGLYSTLLRWLHTPLSATSKAAHINNRSRNHRALRAGAMRQSAANHAFSR